jgi:hypothetical protein
MKKLVKISLVLVAMIAFGATSFAQQQATAHVSTDARIIAPITIAGTQSLEFGDIAVGTTGGSATVATNGSTSTTGDVSLPSAGGGASRHNAIFTVGGLANATYTITLTNATITLSDGGANTMSVGTFVTDPTPTGTLDGTGAQVINVGGTITVSGSQAVGTYTNAQDLEITVAYN